MGLLALGHTYNILEQVFLASSDIYGGGRGEAAAMGAYNQEEAAAVLGRPQIPPKFCHSEIKKQNAIFHLGNLTRGSRRPVRQWLTPKWA